MRTLRPVALCSYPQALEWPGDGLEAELPADALGDLLSVYARPYTISDARGAEIEVAEVRGHSTFS